MVAIGGKTCGKLSCSKKPSYDYACNEKRQLCDQDATDGMVGGKNKLCAYSGCFKHRSHGIAGSRWSEVGSEHAVHVVVRISCKEELEEGSSKQPELPGDNTTEPCSVDASDGMVDVLSRRCAGENCVKKPVFGFEGGMKAIFCAEYAPDGMIDIAKKTCAHDIVRKGPSSGIAGARNLQLGAWGAPGGLGNIAGASWRRATEGSSIGLNCRAANNRTEEVPGEHTPGGMMDVALMRCVHEGYLKHPKGRVLRSRPRDGCASYAIMG